MSTPLAYLSAVSVGAVIAAVLCVGCRRWPGAWVGRAGRAIAAILAVDAVVFAGTPLVEGHWSVRSSLPLALCDVALVVAAIACWSPGWSLGVELAYYWGLAGTLQAVLTPDLGAGYPSTWVLPVRGWPPWRRDCGPLPGGGPAARPPSRIGATSLRDHGGLRRVRWGVRLAHRIELHVPRRAPENPSLLSVLAPWPWYLFTATAVAFALLVVLDLPFLRDDEHRPARA